MAKQNRPILFEDCPDLLVTTCPDSLVQSVQLVNGLVRRAGTHKQKGSAIYGLNRCGEVDAGAILLLMHGGYRLARQGWQACVSGEGEAMDLIARHLDHYLRAKGDRSDCPREEGDYLLREICTPTEMVEEISEWADSVQLETNATREQVAEWKFQISEVTTNGFQHGLSELDHSPPLMIAGKSSPDGSNVQLAAIDYGRSIPMTIAALADETGVPDDDGKRIVYACKKHVSSRRLPANQGAGLFKLVESVKKNGGRLLVLSRNGLFHVSGGRCYSRKLRPIDATTPILEGTLTVVNLRVS